MKTNAESIESDASKLQDKIYRVRDWKLEDDVAIGRGLKMAEKWDKDLEKIVQMMRELKTLQREHDVEETEIEVEKLKKLVEDLEENVEEVKEKIAKEDNERELYSLDKTKVNKVELPTFAGKDHEDFSKFKEDVEKRFKTNRTSRDEQIIKLRECLKGHARKLVPDSNVTEIKEAWSILKQAFGNPIKIINQRKEALMKLGARPKDTANLDAVIAWYIDITTFLREIIDLGVKNPDYSELIFTTEFAMHIRSLFPYGKVRDKLRKCEGQGKSHLENMLELIKEWLENAQINQQEIDVISKSALAPSRYSSTSSSKSGGRSAAHFSRTSSIITEDSDYEDEELDNEELPMLPAFKPPRRHEKCRVCQLLEKDGDTRNLYDDHIHSYPSGCPRYIQMTVKERYQVCKRAKICMSCHDPDYTFKNYDSSNHDCPGRSGRKGRYSCTKCDLHMWVCEKHQEDNQEALERFRERYKNDFSLDFGLVVIGSVFGHISPFNDVEDSGPGETPLSANMSRSKDRKSPTKKTSRNFNKSHSSKGISTTEATRMLERKLSDSGEKIELRPIPAGRAQFMIGQTRGKTGPLNILYDSGCYALLLREGVQRELEACVLKTKGPFTVNGVGNTSVTVNDEWQTTLPLVDGSRQAVEGWTVDEVTAPLPRIDLARAVKELKNDDKENTKLQNMFVELVTGGQVDILLGQMYNAIFPIHVHSLPSGLTIYELQVASHDSQVNSVIGGPHESFEYIAQQVGGASLVFAHLMQSLEAYKDFGPPSLSKSVMSLDDEKFAIEHKELEMNDLIEDLVEQEDLKYQLLDEESDDQSDAEEKEALNDCKDSTIKENNDQRIQDKGDDDQCQNEDWTGAITSSNTRQCLSSSPTLSTESHDQPGTRESEAILDDKEQNVNESMVCITCGENYADVDLQRNLHVATDDDNESIKTLKKLQYSHEGMQIEYRCPRCRECNACKRSFETECVSLREEAEDTMIHDSIKIDFEKKEIICSLPTRGEEHEFLSNNRDMALKVLDQQCHKYNKDVETKETIVKAFNKLLKNKQMVLWTDLSEEERKTIEAKPISHYIPWRVVFKSSLSTPARPVFDASMNTKVDAQGRGGRSLNDLVVKGKVTTLNLVKMIMRFQAGAAAVQGDLKQFYASIKLVVEQWNLQRVLYRRDLDIENEALEAVIKTLIWGVKSVSGQSEASIIQLAEFIKSKKPKLYDFLINCRFCDDLGNSAANTEELLKLTEDADKLFAQVGLECKGWSFSGKEPAPDLAEDGQLISIGGMKWHPQLDTLEC